MSIPGAAHRSPQRACRPGHRTWGWAALSIPIEILSETGVLKCNARCRESTWCLSVMASTVEVDHRVSRHLAAVVQVDRT